jgi:TetR/AcrR family transcriptional repressor of nem operon
MVIDPAYAQTADPVERIFAVLSGYRDRILQTECQYGCPLGRLALEIDPENRPAHKLIAENFAAWIEAIRECVVQFSKRMHKGTDPEALATFVLSVMEGGVMLSRSYRSVAPFDLAVAQLRQHFALLVKQKAKARRKR